MKHVKFLPVHSVETNVNKSISLTLDQLTANLPRTDDKQNHLF